MFGSVCWGESISKLDRGRLQKIVKKSKKKQVMLWESHWTVFKTLHEKRLYRKLMQILNDPTHPMRHYFDGKQGWKIFTSENNTNRYKALFLPSALSVFNENDTSH